MNMEDEELLEINKNYNADLEEHFINEDETTVKEVIESDCSLSTKSIFALKYLIKKIPNGEIRPQQLLLISKISETMEFQDDGLLQAGTGVGKSIAYLIPAIISGRKCFISTSTKQLTSQLTDKDLPLLKKYLFPDLKFSGLQSLSNYICIKKFTDMYEDMQENYTYYQKFRDDDRKAIETVAPQYEEYLRGNISPVDFTVESLGCNCESFQCAGSNCVRGCKFKNKGDCPVNKIIKKVRASDVVITNHAYISRMLVNASKDEKKELGILKGRYLWICDEAHDLEHYLENAFSTELSAGAIKYKYIPKITKYLETEVMESTFRGRFKEYQKRIENSDTPIPEDFIYKDSKELMEDVRSFGLTLGNLYRMMDKYKVEADLQLGDGQSVEEVFEFRDNDIELIKESISVLLKIQAKLDTLSSIDVKYVPTTKSMLSEVLDAIQTFYLAHENKSAYVTYYNYARAKGDNDEPFKMSATYLKTGDALQASLGYLDKDKSDLITVNETKINLIGVSATLCVEGSFRDTADKLGMTKLKDIHCRCVDVGTVFDYEHQGLMYIPTGIPDVKYDRTNHFEFFKNSIKDLIEISHGGALILCTTIKETTETYQFLLGEFGDRYTVLSADDKKWKSKNDLVKAFRDDENSILVGTRGFFQGLDVQGDSLRLLCLNKLPFGNPRSC